MSSTSVAHDTSSKTFLYADRKTFDELLAASRDASLTASQAGFKCARAAIQEARSKSKPACDFCPSEAQWKDGWTLFEKIHLDNLSEAIEAFAGGSKEEVTRMCIRVEDARSDLLEKSEWVYHEKQDGNYQRLVRAFFETHDFYQWLEEKKSDSQ